MDPLKVLIEEHKVILKMVECLKVYGKNLNCKDRVCLIDQIVEFFRVFADKLHHGKEEKILFKRLEKKPLKAEEKAILLELYSEHKKARELVSLLENKKNAKFFEIKKIIEEMVLLYEKHIEKENREFFIPAFTYFSNEEKKEMLDDFLMVDKKVLFEKYLQMAEDFTNNIKNI